MKPDTDQSAFKKTATETIGTNYHVVAEKHCTSSNIATMRNYTADGILPFPNFSSKAARYLSLFLLVLSLCSHLVNAESIHRHAWNTQEQLDSSLQLEGDVDQDGDGKSPPLERVIDEIEDEDQMDFDKVCETKLSPALVDRRIQNATCVCDWEGAAIGATCTMNDVCLDVHGATFSGDLRIKMVYLILNTGGKKDIMDTIVDATYQACFRYNELYDGAYVCLEDMGLYTSPKCGVKVDERSCNGCAVCDNSGGTVVDCSNLLEGELTNQCAGDSFSKSLLRFVHPDVKVSNNCKGPGNSLGIMAFLQASFNSVKHHLQDAEGEERKRNLRNPEDKS